MTNYSQAKVILSLKSLIECKNCWFQLIIVYTCSWGPFLLRERIFIGFSFLVGVPWFEIRCEQFSVAFRILTRHHLENLVSCSSFQFTLFFERREFPWVRLWKLASFFCFQNIVQSFVPVFHVLVILLHDRIYRMLIL